MNPRVLIAGVGNVFFGDDGFGVAVAHALMTHTLPANTVVRDIGIRGLHLAYELVDDWDLLIVVDAVSMGTEPGTVHLIEPTHAHGLLSSHDAHGMDLATILQTAQSLGATLPRVLLVGCDVLDVSSGVGLSPAVERAVVEASRMVETVVGQGSASFVILSSVPSTKEAHP